MRTRIPAGTKALSILASYDGVFEDVGFTLVVYTSASVVWDKTVSQAPFMHKVGCYCCLESTRVNFVFVR